jgi:protein-tyrosine phosphatase
MMIKVLFVCMGNICRSPTAEGVFRYQVEQAGFKKQIIIDSAGTHSYHVGSKPDSRAQEAAAKRGFDLSRLRARQVRVDDFREFDYVLAMDRDNLASLQDDCPAEHMAKLQLFLSYARRYKEKDVPDPYYGGRKGFEFVLDLVEDAAEGLLKHITEKHSLHQ